MRVKSLRDWGVAGLVTVLAAASSGAALAQAVAPHSVTTRPVIPAPAPAPGLAPHPVAASAVTTTTTTSVAPVVKTTATPTRRLHRRSTLRTYARPGPLSTVQSANSGARDYPTSGAYINSALYYDFEPGRLYTVHASPHFLTAITLRPGEKLISKAAGDTIRWVLGETIQGAGASQQVIVMVKPVRGNLRTNIILTTDQRTYLLDARSYEGDTYTSVISWNYPQEQLREAQAARAAEAQSVVASGLAIDQLHFGYDIRPIHSGKPSWQPIRVFDDGLKTYIQFPTNMAATEAPPLFLIGSDKQVQLVNYRYLGGYYIVDRLIDVAELRLGEKNQTVVRITRTRDRG
ncbi:P-type conjugative transfer protein TrbG [Phenylobacterium sp.]|uniref:P-type conjugative transfer protein TrbG n=1 Tax=Phenylobacterium sp. TaxID=1871053 RepID=UPI00374D84DA